MAHSDSPSTCGCGCENLQRVIVERVAGRPITTDFVACVECACMFLSPLPRPKPAAPASASPPPPAPRPPRPVLPPGHGIGSLSEAPFVPQGWLDPADALAAFKAEVEVAAKDYAKPGRHTKLGDKRRR